MHIVFHLLFLLSLFILAVSAQPPETKSGTASVSGRVTRGDKPLVGILISANRGNQYNGWEFAGIVTKTDEDGRYQFTNLATGQYIIVPRAMADVLPGNDNPGKPVLVQEGDAVENLDFSLVKGGVITGTVTDENDKPIVEAAVRLLRKSERGPSMNYSPSSQYLMNRTDDRGVYRLFGLPPGKYLVCVGGEQYNSSPQRRYGGTYYPQTFFPGVTKEAEAKVVEVSAESESKDVDIKLGKAEKTYTVGGRIMDATTGTPLVGLRVGHTLISSDGRYGTVGQERTNLQGEFEIRGLSPGSHLVYLASDEGVHHYTEPKKFEIVSSDINNLELKATLGSSLSGRVVIEGTKDATLLADLASLALFCRSEQAGDIPSGTTVRINPDGSFRVTGIIPGKLSFNLGRRGGLAFSSPRPFILRIEKDGKVWPDSLPLGAGENAANVRIVIGYGVGVIRGQINVNGGQLSDAGQVRVVLQSRGNERDSRTVIADTNGRFYIEGLLPGEYQLTAYFNRPPTAGKNRKLFIPPSLTVTGEKETQVTLTLDLTEEEK